MTIDGRVNGLNRDVYSTLQTIRQKNPGNLTEADANQLKTAINKDGKVDAAEADLLDEITSSQFRSISVSQEGAPAGAASVVAFPASGKAKDVLQGIRAPKLNLEQHWNEGATGFKALTEIAGRSPEARKQVVDFIVAKFETSWSESSLTNGYAPLRGVVAKAYSFAMSSGGPNVNAGRNLIHESMSQLDKKNGDKIPDFLYNWVRPGGLL